MSETTLTFPSATSSRNRTSHTTPPPPSSPHDNQHEPNDAAAEDNHHNNHNHNFTPTTFRRMVSESPVQDEPEQSPIAIPTTSMMLSPASKQLSLSSSWWTKTTRIVPPNHLVSFRRDERNDLQPQGHHVETTTPTTAKNSKQQQPHTESCSIGTTAPVRMDTQQQQQYSSILGQTSVARP